MKFLNAFGVAAFLLIVGTEGFATSVEETGKHRFTFSYPFDDDDAMKPRGGSSKGVPVTLDARASAAWQALQAADISSQERDRRAILAMAGEYRVSFDFLEVLQFDASAPKDRPYQSWATEKVYVVENRPDFVSLQHILVMHLLDDAGKPQTPMVIKHWRQDWQYQPGHLDTYLGPVRWQRRALTLADSAGRWSQTAYQVDDSPRYAALGTWQHNASFSTWIGNDTLRPLPRREYTFRDDYQVLIASNRHTVLPTGWVQEENNLKQRIIDAKSPASKAVLPFAAREYGIARYQRIRDNDFSAGDDYWQRTAALWSQVRMYWDELFKRGTTVCLRAAPDQKLLFEPLFELAGDEKKLAKATSAQLRTWARKNIDGYLSTDSCAAVTAASVSY